MALMHEDHGQFKSFSRRALLLGGGAVGVGTLVLLLVRGIVNAQRRYFANASFVVLWFVFILVAIGAQSLLWMLTSAYHGVVFDPRSAAFQGLTTIALYPCLVWIFAQAQRAFLRP